MTPGLEAIVSDLDGTLVGTEEANLAAYREAFANEGVPFDADAYRSAFGLRFGEMLEIVAPGTPADTGRRIAAGKATVYPRYFGSLHVNAGLVSLLRSSRGMGLATGLATTASATNTRAVLAFIGAIDLFDVVVTGEQVRNGKPDPECYLRACMSLRIAPERTLVFEDTALGVRAAEAAGCAVMQVSASRPKVGR